MMILECVIHDAASAISQGPAGVRSSGSAPKKWVCRAVQYY